MATSNKELLTRYQEHTVAMGRHMREAADHINANAVLDLDPKDLREEITSIIVMLREAEYHAERMEVYTRLMSPLRDDGTLRQKVDREFH